MGDKPITLVFSNTCYTCPLMSAFLQGNEYIYTHATAHTVIINSINYMYKLCLSTVKDDRHEKEERKTNIKCTL